MKQTELRLQQLIGEPGWEMKKLPQSGSDRVYWRLSKPGSSSTMIATYNADLAENRAFFAIDEALAQAGVNVPRIIRCDGNDLYLQQDLGDTSLFSLIDSGTLDAQLLDSTMKMLAMAHWKAPRFLDFEVCYPVKQVSARDIMWDLNYFKYCWLKPSGRLFDENKLQDDLDALCADILDGVAAQPAPVLMLRDFQSRNIMVHEQQPYIIDFQGARKGVWLYDVVSFAWQGRAGFSPEMRQEIIGIYMRHACEIMPELKSYDLSRILPATVLFRSLQTLGAYGFRGLVERKPQFMSQMQPVLANINALRESLSHRFPALFDALPVPGSGEDATPKGLTVTVSSFSYRKGYPSDMADPNGGGFVFDCRSIHNPGRYECYKALTGIDREVAEFLENDGEIIPFLEHATSLVMTAVEKYLKRGFTSLSVNFGCTGGRHRSVYSAEAMARALARRGDVNVHLIHREQDIDRWL